MVHTARISGPSTRAAAGQRRFGDGSIGHQSPRLGESMLSRDSNRIIAAVGVVLELDGKPHPAITADVSTGGMRVMLKHPAPPGTPLVVIVVLDNGKRLRLPARVTSNAG